MAVTVEEVLKAISQAAADAYDGSDKEIGLRREEGEPIKDPRVMDGFSVRINGNVLRVSYHSECTLKEVSDDGFEREIEEMIGKIVTYLKKECKANMGTALKLKKIMSEPDIMVQSLSRIRSWVQAHQDFEIGNYEIEIGEHSNILKESHIPREEGQVDWKEMTRRFIEEGRESRTSEVLKGDRLQQIYKWGGDPYED